MENVIIIVKGGNVQILPNATEATMVFRFDRLAGEFQPDCDAVTTQTEDERRLLMYVEEERLPHYLSLIAGCRTATELGRVIVDMAAQEPKLLKEEIVKERFISVILPLAVNLTHGTSIDNIRARINDALALKSRQRTG